jgi:hypothetical protein
MNSSREKENKKNLGENKKVKIDYLTFIKHESNIKIKINF